jgi:hypothetical protein
MRCTTVLGTGVREAPTVGFRPFVSGVSFALGLATLACSEGGRECNVGADCASGACSVAGMCVPNTDAGADVGADGGSDAHRPDSSTSPDTDPTEGSCVATDGGTILASQLVFMAGLHATFRIAENVTVSTAGETLPDGSRSWDLSGALSGDHDVLVETLTVASTWYASKFPDSSYASPLSDTSSLLGVFQVTPSDLLLQGVVSPDAGVEQTELSYAPAVSTLQFPLMEGATWSTNATVTGMAEGVYGEYTEGYESSVDAYGTMKTPLATFRVLRVGTVLTRTVGITVTVIRSFVFVTDCYGPVAAITSQDDETSSEFTSAAEVRRIAP